ncbi:unnamed protein product, partial [Polarella glacialis]
YVFITINYVVQGTVLYMISKEEHIWDLFAGQMYLCDFGAYVQTCPDGPNCVGPGGTKYTPGRIYDFSTWSTRNFVLNTVKQLFPKDAGKIDEMADPGEYGLESYLCRWLCCSLFVVSVMSDLWDTISFAKLLWKIPNKAEPWIDFEVPTWAEKEVVKEIRGMTELDFVHIRIAGMPIHWKIINVCFVLLPKMMLWYFTVDAGILFLMESSGIDDLVVNSVALAFILQIDELVCSELMSEVTKMVLEKVEDYEMEDVIAEEILTDEEVLDKDFVAHHHPWAWSDIFSLLPMKLGSVVSVMAIFVYQYYLRNCIRHPDGGWVSKPMYLPKSTDFSVLNAFLWYWFPIETHSEPYWTPPDVNLR